MKPARVLSFTFLLLFMSSCQPRVDIPEGLPGCLKERISEILEEPRWNPSAQVIEYTYEGKLVYFIPRHCCDIPSELYDENCNLICFPDGGLGGNGDGRCMDFLEQSANGVLRWSDPRAENL